MLFSFRSSSILIITEIDHRLIEKIDITWDEIDKNGGVGDFVNRLRKKYDIPERW